MLGGTGAKKCESRMQIAAKVSGSETDGILMELFTPVFPLALRR